MGTNSKQNSDGSISFVTDNGSKEVARFGGDNAAGTTWRAPKTVVVPLTALDTGGGVLSWLNPEAGAIIIKDLTLDITTKSTAASTVDGGVTVASATTLNDTLIDGLDVGTAAGTFDNITDKGTNGKSRQRLAAGGWVTVSRASGACAGLVGFAYITYLVV